MPAGRKKELLDLMKFVEFTNLFKAQERLIWFKGVDTCERDGEHAFQLAIVCWYANERFKLGLDIQRLIEYALVHDLVETYAKDTPAFVNNGNGGETPCRDDKRMREFFAMKRIKKLWRKTFPAMVHRLDAYDLQTDSESRFVYAMDKLLAQINITLDDGRTNFRLDTTLEAVDAYKRPRISRHPFVLELYDELFKTWLADPQKYFPGKLKAAE
jgi:putative hydrolase of HD superfamily